MKNELTQILRHCFNKGSVEELEESEVRKLADQYPYFTAGHVILAKYLHQNQSTHSDDSLSKSALYLCNPIWLNAFITDDQAPGATLVTAPAVEPPEVRDESVELVGNEPVPATGYDSTKTTFGSTDDEDGESNAAEAIAVEKNSEADTRQEEEIVAEIVESEPLIVADTELESDFIESIQREEEVQPVQVDEDTSTGRDQEQVFQEKTDSTPDFEPAEIFKNSTSDTNQADSQSGVPPLSTETIDYDEQSRRDEVVEATSLEGEVSTNAEQEGSELLTADLESKPDVQTTAANDVADPGQLAFEPFHTVDYFASQGIKLQQAEMGQDKLGKQLRSFTEWLRSMKRLPQTEPVQADDTSIHRIAEHSLEDKEILTEAMAEVWLKQGNREKAVAIYRKLSLQNPSKSSYFAAKIEQLNSL